MTTFVDTGSGCSCPATADSVSWSGVSSGSVSLSPNSTPVLIATVPFTTGQNPLTTGLWGILWMSWEAKSATAGKFSIAERKFVAAVKGDTSIGSYLLYTSEGLDGDVQFAPNPNVGLRFDAGKALATYVQLSSSVNGSGDLEISLNCLSTDNHGDPGVAWVFNNLSAEFRIVGVS